MTDGDAGGGGLLEHARSSSDLASSLCEQGPTPLLTTILRNHGLTPLVNLQFFDLRL